MQAHRKSAGFTKIFAFFDFFPIFAKCKSGLMMPALVINKTNEIVCPHSFPKTLASKRKYFLALL